jgi:hypothetical protein
VFEALELYWGSETADTIMNEEYLDKDLVLRAIIEKYLCFSIGCNVNAINEITEI